MRRPTGCGACDPPRASGTLRPRRHATSRRRPPQPGSPQGPTLVPARVPGIAPRPGVTICKYFRATSIPTKSPPALYPGKRSWMASVKALAVPPSLKPHSSRSSLLYSSAWKTPYSPRPILYVSGCSRRSTPSYGYLAPSGMMSLPESQRLPELYLRPTRRRRRRPARLQSSPREAHLCPRCGDRRCGTRNVVAVPQLTGDLRQHRLRIIPAPQSPGCASDPTPLTLRKNRERWRVTRWKNPFPAGRVSPEWTETRCAPGETALTGSGGRSSLPSGPTGSISLLLGRGGIFGVFEGYGRSA